MGIPPRLRDFQAVWESPVFGLFHVAAFSTAFLPTNSATEPFLIVLVWMSTCYWWV